MKKKILSFFMALALLAQPLMAALSTSIAWEMRTTGSDTNGGGFKKDATGTDWSQQDAAQYSLTNGTTNGTTTIATVSASTDMIGNVVYVAGGTGAVVGAWYEITGVSAGVSITVDRSTGLTAGTGTTLNIGGAIRTFLTISTITTTGNIIWVKNTATYSMGTGVSFAPAGGNVATTFTIQGYGSTRGDSGRATAQASAGSITMFSMSGFNSQMKNMIVDGNNQTSVRGISLTQGWIVQNCILKNFTNSAINMGGTRLKLLDSEVTGCSTQPAIANASVVLRCVVHDNTVSGIQYTSAGNAANISDNLIYNNSGATSDGVVAVGSSGDYVAQRNTIYNNGRHGINDFGSNTNVVENNVIVNNGGYGITNASYTTGGVLIADRYANNLFYNNVSGNFQNYTLPVNGNVALTGDPFTNAASGDFSLNNTAGAGAAVRAAGIPGTFIGGLTIGYRDGGAVQHQDSGGSGGTRGFTFAQ